MHAWHLLTEQIRGTEIFALTAEPAKSQPLRVYPP